MNRLIARSPADGARQPAQGEQAARGEQSLWSATAAPLEVCPTLTTAERAQVVVIGAGYTGLSAALHLSEAGRDVVVLEAEDIGHGASGRNGGQVIPGLKFDPDVLEAMYGTDLGPSLVATVGGGPDVVFELIRKHAIDCDAVRAGWLQLATSESALRAIEARVRQWRARGAAVEMLSRADAARLAGTERYFGGLIDRRGGTLQPLSYARGLARAARTAGARLYAHSRAIRLERCDGGWRILTRGADVPGADAPGADAPGADAWGGEVKCAQVVFATNAYSDKFVEPLQRTVVAVPSLQVATVPLPPQWRRSILPEGQAVSDTWRLLRYFRLDAAGRLLMGSRGVYGDGSPRRAAGPHLRAVREIFPQLEGIAYEYQWAGYVAVTPDHLPHMHEMAPGIVAGLGYNGRGVAMATVMGRLLARRLLGEPAETLGFPVTPVRPIRLHRFSRLVASAAIQYLRMRDGVSRVTESLARRRE